MNKKVILFAVDFAIIAIFLILFYENTEEYSNFVFLISFFVFLYYTIIFILMEKRLVPSISVNISPEICLVIFYYILFFHPYLLHFLGIADYYIVKYLPYAYPGGANKGLLACTIGIAGFHLGSRIPRRFTPVATMSSSEPSNAHDLFDFVLPWLTASLMAFYLLSGLQSADTGRYTKGELGGNSAGDGLYVIIVMICLLGVSRLVTLLARHRRLRWWHWFLAILIFFWSLRIGAAGDRNNFLLIALAALGGAAAFLIRVRWTSIVVLLIFGLFAYNVVEVLRRAPEISWAAIEDAYSATQQKDEGDNSFAGTTAGLRASFVITPDLSSYGLGFYKLVGFMGIVPFSRGIFLSGYQGFYTTADALTYYIIGPNAGWGVGSNIISDIYMDFGIFGIPVLMSSLGWSVARVRADIVRHGPTTKLVFIYVSMMGLLGEIPRYSFDFPVRMISWGLAIILVYEFFVVKRRAKRQRYRAPYRPNSDRHST